MLLAAALLLLALLHYVHAIEEIKYVALGSGEGTLSIGRLALDNGRLPIIRVFADINNLALWGRLHCLYAACMPALLGELASSLCRFALFACGSLLAAKQGAQLSADCCRTQEYCAAEFAVSSVLRCRCCPLPLC